MESEQGRRTTYLAYMLRLWQVGSHGGQPVWRASLENAHTGERLAFGDTQALFAFLTELTASCAEASGTGATTESTGTDELGISHS